MIGGETRALLDHLEHPQPKVGGGVVHGTLRRRQVAPVDLEATALEAERARDEEASGLHVHRE